ncbi:MAG: N-formylglutamate amidohydrolase [Rhodospirillales bacterium]|nr:MAG: N-formylglutamate amidohydrolase [Rhodospirillales bacterium]
MPASHERLFPPPAAGSPADFCLGPSEPPPFEVLNADGRAPLLLVCDHASNVIPAALNRLGLAEAMLERHIAYDIGSGDLTRMLSARLDAPAVLAGYSRLLIDVNRQPGDPQSILAESDGVPIPGNVGLSEAAQHARAEAFHWPYHHAIETVFAHLRRRGPEPLLFSIHTFTPSLGGRDRLWDVGVLWNRDPRLAVPLLDLLRRHPITVGDNEPYSGKKIAYTLNLHAGAAGLANAAVEIRQDHCESTDELRRWTDILGEALGAIVGMDHLHRVEVF